MNPQTGTLQSGGGRVATGPRTLHPSLALLPPKTPRGVGGLFHRPLRRKRRTLSRSLETDGAGRRADQYIAVDVRDGDQRVIERRLDMGDAPSNVAPYAFFPRALSHVSAP